MMKPLLISEDEQIEMIDQAIDAGWFIRRVVTGFSNCEIEFAFQTDRLATNPFESVVSVQYPGIREREVITQQWTTSLRVADHAKKIMEATA